jgi:O-antigen/teichoic acid export membrane protein
MHPLRLLARDTAVYGLSSIVGRILHYLLVPLYTALLCPAEYGIVTEFYAYAAFLNVLYSYGMETAYFRFATLHQPTEVYRLTTYLLLGSSMLFSAALIGLATPLSARLGYPGHERYVYYLAALVSLDTCLLIPFARLRLNNQALRFALLKCLQIGVQIGLNVLFFWDLSAVYDGQCPVYLKPPSSLEPIECIFLANLIGNSVALPFLAQQLIGGQWPRLSWKKVRPMMLYALPLLATGLAGITNEMLSRVLLKHLLPYYPGINEPPQVTLGIFGACYKLAIFIPLATQAFRYAAEPFFLKENTQPASSRLFSQVMHVYIVIGCFIWFAISANLDVLGYLFLRNPIYRSGIEIVPYLSFAYLWLGIYYNLSVWFKLTQKTYYSTLITGLGSLLTLILNFLLVPIGGYWGSVVATVCSHASMAALCYGCGQRLYPIAYHTRQGLTYIFMTLVLVILLRYIPYTNRCEAFWSNVGLTILFGGVCYRSIQKFLTKKHA